MTKNFEYKKEQVDALIKLNRDAKLYEIHPPKTNIPTKEDVGMDDIDFAFYISKLNKNTENGDRLL